MCGSQIGTLSPSLTVMTGNLEGRRRLPDSLRWVIREFRISALITTHRDTGAHKPGTHPLCLIFAIIRVSCLEKEREERQKKEREREGREGWREGGCWSSSSRDGQALLRSSPRHQHLSLGTRSLRRP